MDINRHTLDTVFRNLRADWRTAYATSETSRAEALSIATSIPMTTATMRFDFLTDNPEFREWIDQRKLLEYASKSYTVDYKEWELTMRMLAKDMRDDNLGLYSVQAQGGGEAAGRLIPREVFKALDDGQTRTCYDGQNFFDTDHPVGVGADATTASNIYGDGGGYGPWYLLDTSRAVKPILWLNREDPSFTWKNRPQDDNVFFDREYYYGGFAAGAAHYGMWQTASRSENILSMTNLETVYNAMVERRGDRLNEYGRRSKLGIRPDTLVVAAGLDEARAKILMDQPRINSSDDPLQSGDSTIPNRMYKKFRIVVASWLDGSTS